MSKNEKPANEAIDGLKSRIGTEKARLRWRLATNELLDEDAERETPPPGSRRSGKLYEIFRALEAE